MRSSSSVNVRGLYAFPIFFTGFTSSSESHGLRVQRAILAAKRASSSAISRILCSARSTVATIVSQLSMDSAPRRQNTSWKRATSSADLPASAMSC